MKEYKENNNRDKLFTYKWIGSTVMLLDAKNKEVEVLRHQVCLRLKSMF